jgi:hypothetical protein
MAQHRRRRARYRIVGVLAQSGSPARSLSYLTLAEALTALVNDGRLRARLGVGALTRVSDIDIDLRY